MCKKMKEHRDHISIQYIPVNAGMDFMEVAKTIDIYAGYKESLQYLVKHIPYYIDVISIKTSKAYYGMGNKLISRYNSDLRRLYKAM